MKLAAVPAICLLLVIPVSAQSPFRKGINFSEWLMAPRIESVDPGLATAKDFADMRMMGLEAVRLTINLDRMARNNPDGHIPPQLFHLLDDAVACASRNGLCLILDNHTQEDDGKIDADIEETLPRIWSEMARHFRSAPSSVLFEIFNEPHDIPATDWRRIQAKALAAIRAEDPDRTVIVTGTEFGKVEGLLAMKPYDDPNLLYSFHIYHPMIFTHQGVSWVGWGGISGVPFPPDPSRPPRIPDGPDRSGIEAAAKAYMAGNPVAEIGKKLDQAVAWAKKHKVRLFCGEFGAFITYAPPADRERWYRLVKDMLGERGIPYTSWEYRGGFGLFDLLPNLGISSRLNVPMLTALGLDVPPATAASEPGPGKGFPVLIGGDLAPDIGSELLKHEGWGSYLDADGPSPDQTSISFSDAERFSTLAFVFPALRDLRGLARRGSLDLWIKLEGQDQAFEIRFLMPSGNGRVPWRMSISLDPKTCPWDGTWRHVSLPLARFRETGAWDGAYHEPAGKWDWSQVAGLEIVAEYGDFEGRTLKVAGIELRSGP